MFGLCGLPQAWKSYKDGHTKGISDGFLFLWTGGEIFTLIYVLSLPILSWPLIVNYSINLVSVITMIKYKFWERN